MKKIKSITIKKCDFKQILKFIDVFNFENVCVGYDKTCTDNYLKKAIEENNILTKIADTKELEIVMLEKKNYYFLNNYDPNYDVFIICNIKTSITDFLKKENFELMVKKDLADAFIDFWYEENRTYITITKEAYDKSKKIISQVIDY